MMKYLDLNYFAGLLFSPQQNLFLIALAIQTGNASFIAYMQLHKLWFSKS